MSDEYTIGGNFLFGKIDEAEYWRKMARLRAQSQAEASRKRDGSALICQACGGPVIVERDRYRVFERMHWICFHFEFEHMVEDRDEPCGDPDCPVRCSA